MTADGAGTIDGASIQTGQSPREPRPVSRPTVFFLPGLFGDQDPEIEKFLAPTRFHLDLVPITYFDWARHIETDCDYSVLVRHLLAHMEEKVPSGPIRMAGYSLGGHLAFALAVAFEAKGRPVESLAILDAPLDFASAQGTLRKRLHARLLQLRGFNLLGGLTSVVSKLLIMDKSHRALRRLIPYKDRSLPFELREEMNRKLTMQLVIKIYQDWWQRTLAEAAPLEAPWNLFRSQEHEAYESDDLGWAAHCRNVNVVHVAGSHRGMLDPSVNGPLRAAFIAALSTGSGQR